VSRREQRSRDRDQGLIPFAVKLPGELVKKLHARAQHQGMSLNEVAAQLLEKGLQE
jgi:predicted HicB family RNase H-like nuclease